MSSYYTESNELLDLASKLKGSYPNLIGYVDLDKIFFAFKSTDSQKKLFKYEISGMPSEWAASIKDNSKLYCISFSYDYFTIISEGLLHWIMIDLLYSCDTKMKGGLRRKDVVEHWSILSTLEDLGCSVDWREDNDLPILLGDEFVNFRGERDEFV